MNVGEEICGEWLRHARGCEFVQYNLRTTQVQGEIDVIGINLLERQVYVCEVAIHLVTGLLYEDNVERLLKKFRKDIDYAEKAFADYERHYMLWSPVVRQGRVGAKHDQLGDVAQVVKTIEAERGVTITAVVNERFQEELDALRRFAAGVTKELDSSVMRYLQIEEYLKRHLGKGTPVTGTDAT